MKHITLMTMAAMMSVTMQAQVFTSGVEDWTESVPNDFVGSKTNIAASAVTQVSEDVHGGSFAVRLENTATSHKRFTTQPVEVVAGTAYDVNFWVRGEGKVRVGLYDGRADLSGYAAYNPTAFVQITGNTWQEVTLSIVCTHDTTGGEFIISVASTVAPEHLVIDDVNITEGTVEPPMEVTIFEIQNSSAPDGASPLNGQAVITSGIVTAVFPETSTNRGYFIQDAPGAWNGVFVFDQANLPSMGDEVTFTSIVSEYFTFTELTSVTGYSVVSTGNPLPASVSVGTLSAADEQYESVLVTAVNSACTDPSAANGQWIIDDGSAPLFVSPLIFDFTATLGTNYDVTGPMYYSFGEWKVVPRMLSDIVIATGIGEFAGVKVTVFPNPASDVITLDLGTLNGRTEISMHDATGRLVFADVATADRSSIHVNALNNGVYVMTLRNAGASWSTRIAVQH